MVKKLPLLLLGLFFLHLQACNIINPEEPIPAYIQVDSVRVNVTSGLEGTAHQDIFDIWPTIGGRSLGGYQLPSTFPVLKHGQTDVLIQAGVKENGIAATRTPYPFFTFARDTVMLGPNQTTRITPVFSYRPNTRFAVMENFESNEIVFENGSRSDATIERTTQPEEVFEGFAAMKVAFGGDNAPRAEALLNSVIRLVPGQQTWMELHYRSSVPIQVGLLAHSGGFVYDIPVAGFNPNDRWTKIYFNMTEAVGEMPQGTFFQPYFRNYGQQPAGSWFLLDNVKLLHFE